MNLALQLRAQSPGVTRRVRPRRQPRQVPPRRIEAAYYVALERLVVGPLKRLVLAQLIPSLPGIVAETPNAVNPDTGRGDTARADGYGDTIKRLVAHMHETLDREHPLADVEREVQGIGERTQRHNLDQLRRAFAASLGISNLVVHEPHLADLLRAWATENVGLITTLRARYFADIEALVLRQVTAGRRHEEIAREVEARFVRAGKRRPDGTRALHGVSYQARRIGRDQVNKLNGQLSRTRQQALGVTSYLWRTALDERVREEHARREGKAFDWNHPPEDGHPGEPIQCRCYAEPVLDEV